MKTFVPILLCAASIAPAQSPTLRVVPEPYAGLEGTSASRTPLGWGASRIQYLIDSAQICQNTAVIDGVRLRLDGGNFNIDAPVPQTFQLTITAYEVPLTPSTMTNDWSANIAGATPTIVFQGALQVPAAVRTYPYPNPWTVQIAFPTPFIHQRPRGNLLLDWQLIGGSGSNWPADAVFLHGSDPRGETTRIWEDSACTGAANTTLSLGLTTNNGAGTVGSTFDVTYTGSPSLTNVTQVLGFTASQLGATPLPIDLATLGAPGCQWNVDSAVAQSSSSPSGSMTWPIPNDPSVLGVAAFVQALGVESTTGGITPSQNAWQIRIGSATAPSDGPCQMLHRGNYAGEPTGFLSPTGYYALVMGFDGTFF